MAFKFPGMGFLSMLGGGNDSMPGLGGFGQMLGDFLKSPQSSAAPPTAPAPGTAPGQPSSGLGSSALPPNILQLLMQRQQPGQHAGMMFRPNLPQF